MNESKRRYVAVVAASTLTALTMGVASAQTPPGGPTPSGKCLSDPWAQKPGSCSPMHVVEKTKLTNIATTCSRPKGGDHRSTTVTWRMPKIVDDHKGKFDTVSITVDSTVSRPDDGMIMVTRNGKQEGSVMRLNERQFNRMSPTPQLRTILAFFQRREVLDRFIKDYNKCVIGPTIVAAGGPACKSCRRKTVGFGIAYALVGAVCCVGTAGFGCAGCAGGAIVTGGVAVGALTEACDTTCASEECKANYDRCTGQENTSFQTPRNGKGSDKEKMCKSDYDFCMRRAEM